MDGAEFLLIGFGLVALFYAPTLYAIYKLDWRFNSIKILKFTKQLFSFDLIFDFINDSGTDLMLQQVDIQVFFNGVYIANVNNPYNQNLVKRTSTSVDIQLDLDPALIGETVYNQFLLGGADLSSYHLQLSGYARINNKKFPFSYTMTGYDIYKYIAS